MKSLGMRAAGERLERMKASVRWAGDGFRNLHPVLPGLRADLFASDGVSAFSLDPSVSSKVQILRWLALTASAGLVSQPPSFIVAGPGFRPGLDQGGLQRIFTTSAGLEVLPGDSWTLRGTVYRLTMFDLNDALGTSALAGEGFPEGFEDFDQRFQGTSTGLELSASRRLSRTIGAAIALKSSKAIGYPPSD